MRRATILKLQDLANRIRDAAEELNDIVDDLRDTHDQRSDKWKDSEKGEEAAERLNGLDSALSLLGEAAEELEAGAQSS